MVAGGMMMQQPGMMMQPGMPPRSKQEVMQRIASIGSFTIKQEVALWEAVTQGCIEVPNTYMVRQHS